MMIRMSWMVAACALCLLAVPAHAAPPVEPLAWKLPQEDLGLKPEGGTLTFSLAYTRNQKATTTGDLVLEPSFTDGWGRVFWTGAPVPVIGEAAKPAKPAKPVSIDFAIPYPPLPAGRYLFRGQVRDASGAQVQTVWVPTGWSGKFDFRRDLAWLFWAGGPVSDAMAKAIRDLGMNGAGGAGVDYRFPYGFFRDHAAQVPVQGHPEETFLHPEGTGLDGFRNWIASAIRNDAGMLMISLTDEMTVKSDNPAMRAVRLRLLRADPFLHVPTVSRFNQKFGTDIWSWDEVLREGFPQAKGAFKAADREFADVEMPALRMAVMRQLGTPAAFTPGATHCLYNSRYDSFSPRAGICHTTLDIASVFVQTQAHYGLRPGNMLIKLRTGFYRGSELLGVIGQQEHAYWASLACNYRLFTVYGAGDSYGSVPATADGKVTADGRNFQAIRQAIHGLRPVILETRTRVEPAVLLLMNHYNGGEQNYVEGLVNCGIMPRGGLRPDEATRLIFAIKAPLDTAMPFRAPGGLAELQDAVRRGAGLVLQGNYAKELARLGILVTAPAEGVAPEEVEARQRDDNSEVLSPEGPLPEGAEAIDLSPLASSFPGLAGVTVIGTWGPGATATPESGLQPVRVGGKLLALTGTLGKGWVLYLNFELLGMFRANGLNGGVGEGQLSLLVDSSIPDRNAAFVRALLARAGVPQPLACTDAKGRVHPYLRAFRAQTHDARQEYLYVVSEAAGKLAPDPADAKKQVVVLASEPVVAGRLRILDPAVKAVRDLRAGKLLPLQADGQGVGVDLALDAGKGTILSLLTAEPVGTLDLHLSHAEVAGAGQIQVELVRLDAAGKPLDLPGHSCWVRFLDPQGTEVEALTRWATGSGPHVLPATFALDDPAGEWTVVAEDMTDGTRAQAKLTRREKPDGLRLAFVPGGPLVRGAGNQGVLRVTNAGSATLSLEGATLACSARGVRVSAPALKAGVPAGGTAEVPIGVEVDPAAPAGPALFTLRRGAVVLAGARLDIPAPWTVALDSTPYLDGDLIITEVRGTLRCSAAGPTPLTIRLPAGPAGPAREVTVSSPTAHAEVPFAIPLTMTRAQAQAMAGLRDEGVELSVRAPGLPEDRFRYHPNILALARAPQRIGQVRGGKLTVKVTNFTRAGQQVSITLAPVPGEEGKPWQADTTVAPQSTGTLERQLAGLSALDDPGLHGLDLAWRVGDAAQAAAVLPVEAVAEQEWWALTHNLLDHVKSSTASDVLEPGAQDDPDPDGKGGEPPAFPVTIAEREQAGWRRVVNEGVVRWPDLVPPKFAAGRVQVATQVEAPKALEAGVAFLGPTRPSAAWVNGAPLAMVAPAASKSKNKGVSSPASGAHSALKAGKNLVVVQFEVTPKDKDKPVGCALALLDPATGKRDRSLRIGIPASPAAPAGGN